MTPVLALLLVLAATPSPLPAPSSGGGAEREQVKAPAEATTGQGNRTYTPSPSPTIAFVAPPPNSGEAKHHTDKHAEQSSPEWWTAVATVVLAGVAVLQFIAIGIQAYLLRKQSISTEKAADAANKSAAVAERLLLATQRPFLLCSRFNRAPLLDAKEQEVGFGVTVEWINRGPVPALTAKSTAGAIKIKRGQSQDFKLPELEPRSPSFNVAPQATVSSSGYGEITFAEIEEIAAGTLAVFIYGRVEYRDGFESTPAHHTDVCVRVEIRPGKDRLFAYPAHIEHNYAD